MANNRRKAERKREIDKLVVDGRLAHRTGKPRSSVPWKPFQSTNGQHWLKGWDMEEQLRLDAEQAQRDNVHDHLLAGISHFETTGDQATLAGVLRMIADRLPPVPDELTSEDYEAIYGWGGQG